MKTDFYLLLLFSIIGLSFAAPVRAQDISFDDFYTEQEQEEEEENGEPEPINQYSGKYKKAPLPLGQRKLIADQSFKVHLLRTAKDGPGQVTLRLSSPVMLNGCVKIIQPEVRVQKNNRVIWYRVSDPIVDVDRSVRYAHYQCKQGGNMAGVDIQLDRDELMEENIKSIVLQNGAATDYYDVHISESELTLIPRTMRAFAPRDLPHKIDPLHIYFYPENLIMLYASGKIDRQAVAPKISALAHQRGMIEADSIIKNFTRPLQNSPNFYFIDQSGRIAGQLDYGESVHVGNITVVETFRGARGPYEKQKKIMVYATLPGALD